MDYRRTESNSPRVFKAFGIGLIATLGLFFAVLNISRVDATEHCVETRFGKVVNPKVSDGPVTTISTKLECFPTTQQQFPGGEITGDTAAAEHIEFLTRDSVMVGMEIAANWKYTNVNNAFMTRRSHDAVLAELSNAVRSGAREAGATVGLNDFFGAKRAGMDEIFREAFNRQMSDYAQIDKVYIRHIKLPPAISGAWLATQTAQAQQKEAIAQFVKDSLNARRTVVTAQANAEKTRLETQALATSPEVIRLRTAEAMAKGMSEVCNGVHTCILGGSVIDTWKGVKP